MRQRQVTPQHFVVGTHLYSWVEKGTRRVEWLFQEHNTMTQPALEPGPLHQVQLANHYATASPAIPPIMLATPCFTASEFSLTPHDPNGIANRSTNHTIAIHINLLVTKLTIPLPPHGT